MKAILVNTRIDFMKARKVAYVFSSTLIVISLISVFTRGLNLGIDFTGGLLLEVGYQQPTEVGLVRDTLSKAGFTEASVQRFGTDRDVLIRLAPRPGEANAKISDRAFSALSQQAQGKAELRRVEYVGPQVGKELTEDGGLAILYTLIGILIYVAIRFEWRFSLGSVIALIHDVIITVGVFSVFQFDFDLTVLAAILAVIGYSLNDTIVVFDRIRENFRKVRKGTVVDIVNNSINQTLSRTMMTSGTTLMVLVALFVLGGETIWGFSLALIVGIGIGTYSSIYVASAAAVALGVSRADLMPVKRESELDAMP